MKAIPLNSQKFKAIFVNKLVFLDSLSFADGSLAKLGETLQMSGCEFPILSQWERLKEESVRSGPSYPWKEGGGGEPGAYEQEHINFVLNLRRNLANGKGHYPHEWLTGGLEQLKRQTCLPPKKAFYSRLTDSGPTESEYKAAKCIWDAHDCATMMDFTSVYLETGMEKEPDFFFIFKDSLSLTHYRRATAGRCDLRAEKSILHHVRPGYVAIFILPPLGQGKVVQCTRE